MGLQTELEDITYDSIPILILTIVASALRDLRAVLFNLLRKIPISDIAEQLSLNITAWSSSNLELNSSDDDCVVCLCEMRKGERLRKLECSHVFHTKCLDGWLKQLHFTCPLCRSPVPQPCALLNVAKMEDNSFDLVSWFGFR